LLSGQFFGEAALLEKVRRSATVLALTKVTVYTIKSNEFWFIFGHKDSLEYNDILIKLLRLEKVQLSEKQKLFQWLF